MQEQLRGEASNFAWRLGRCEKRARQLRRQMSAQLRWQSEDVTATETSSSTQLAFIVASSGALSPIASSARLGCPVEPSWYRHSPTEPKQQFRLTETAACELLPTRTALSPTLARRQRSCCVRDAEFTLHERDRVFVRFAVLFWAAVKIYGHRSPIAATFLT